MPLTAAHSSSSLSDPSLARAGASRSMGSTRLLQVEQVLLDGAGLGASAKLQRPAWMVSPLPRRHAGRQRVSQSAKRLLAPAAALLWQSVTRQAARGPWAAQQRPQCLRSLMQLRVQLQVVQAMQRLGKQVSLPPLGLITAAALRVSVCCSHETCAGCGRLGL